MLAVTEKLSRFVADLKFADLPDGIAQRTSLLVLDHIGIALRARNEAALCTSMEQALKHLGMNSGACTVIGDDQGYAPPAAAFFNGNLAHSLDFDDTHAASSLHPGAPIIPAAMAAAEMVGASGADVLVGIIAGFEVQIRLSLALNPSEHYARGFHPTATCGTFGAAAAAARVFGLSREQTTSAFGLCGSQAAGSMQFLADGAWNKPFHTGYAAMNGLISATMAREGFKGTALGIEGKLGFLNAYAPNSNPALVVEGIGERFCTMEVAVKPYPSCRYGHAAMDALIALRKTHGFAIEDIESVEIGLPKTGWHLIGDPLEDKKHPKNVVDGQFSMPFVGAVALREGGMQWDDYASHLKDPVTLDLCKRIDAIVDPVPEAVFPDYMAGIARIKTRTGQHDKFVKIAKGEPANFVTVDELKVKFNALVSPYLGDERRETLIASVLDFATQEDIRALLALTRNTPVAPLRQAGG